MNNTLEIKHLEKNFGKKKILTDVSFTVTKGHIVGLVGANGAGKTTIMKAILGLVGFSNGTITINGESVSLNKHQALSKVGALIENPGIYPYLTGWDHLRLFAEKNITKSMMTELVSALKMDKYIHQKAKGYSLGMKQKLGIALAFLNNPDFVILDEPMNGLDPQATFDLRQLITTKANEGTTFLISSHILGELEKLAKDLVIIDRGQIIKQTTTDELLSTGEKYFVFGQLQAESSKWQFRAETAQEDLERVKQQLVAVNQQYEHRLQSDQVDLAQHQELVQQARQAKLTKWLHPFKNRQKETKHVSQS
ncbi:ABC transporter ATP-binding protein [Weissella sagaensis]|uniref:ABC transporter ATP-binding protein n=1 Tax=Weissella sagaensis TaxID=2559928 RepID=UPI001152DF85|nr:ATP-binding cassette domain-containing protein [Weissella sagaensis]QDJ58907.1 ATP-binding cassette domain-containing protein [Weissella hellenica]